MKAPKLPSFIRSSSNKQFLMQTRYYSERKERIQEAREQAEFQTKEGIKKGHFSTAWKKKTPSTDTSATVRVLVIIATLSAMAYWIIKF
tara:strand:+ start:331 stop:597 length:267 start_codon:yes stop_codon:yes gene_type:complete